jgi:hypothetical protein
MTFTAWAGTIYIRRRHVRKELSILTKIPVEFRNPWISEATFEQGIFTNDCVTDFRVPRDTDSRAIPVEKSAFPVARKVESVS